MTQSNMTSPGAAERPYVISQPSDIEVAAQALAGDAAVAHAFANFYVISARPDGRIVRRINRMKGRPEHQAGSITTTEDRIAGLFDWSRIPHTLSRTTVLDLIDTCYRMGPFGFRGPAAAHIPDHLTSPDGDVRTTQVIAPGYRCPSNDFLGRSLFLTREDFLYITSANRSRHLTGAEDEPAHYRADGICAEFGHEPTLFVLRHKDEAIARHDYPQYEPQSTTILAFHKVAGTDERGRPRLVLERHGSLPVEMVRRTLERFGLGLSLGPKAQTRLAIRQYGDKGQTEAAA
jgi:hypothetical protein